jgi:hypothetical protein
MLNLSAGILQGRQDTGNGPACASGGRDMRHHQRRALRWLGFLTREATRPVQNSGAPIHGRCKYA